MEPKVYYKGNVGDTYCYISSRVWHFSGHTIPVKSVSDIYASYRKNTVELVLGVLLTIAGLVILLSDDWLVGLYVPLLSVGVVLSIIALATRKRFISVVSNSSRNEVITIGYRDPEAQNLYDALFDCLTEGEQFHVSLFDAENDTISISSEHVIKAQTIPCPDCGENVPVGVDVCPNCGCPVSKILSENSTPTPNSTSASSVSGKNFRVGDYAIYIPTNEKVRIKQIDGDIVLAGKDNGVGWYVKELNCSISDLSDIQ